MPKTPEEKVELFRRLHQMGTEERDKSWAEFLSSIQQDKKYLAWSDEQRAAWKRDTEWLYKLAYSTGFTTAFGMMIAALAPKKDATQ